MMPVISEIFLACVDPRYRLFLVIILVILPFFLSSCDLNKEVHVLKVIATAYNSLPGQTQGDPTITAWGIKLVPGMKAIAVSRDLIQMGLTKGINIRIDGLPGTYVVVDKMNKRWSKRIDIYMGTDLKAAKEWGRRIVIIRW